MKQRNIGGSHGPLWVVIASASAVGAFVGNYVLLVVLASS